MTQQPSLFDLGDDPDAGGVASPPDQAARDFAVDPANDVVLEASAGTGKTRVLVERYVRLVEAGVDPRHILAITFTRKAAAEMRDRVLVELRRRRERGAFTDEQWRALRERTADIQISTIDAFCFGLLREFPLEADVDPAFEIADETEMARFSNEALDLTFRAVRALVDRDERVRLLLARVKLPVLRGAVASLLDRRQVALAAVEAFVRRTGGSRTEADVAAAFAGRLRDAILRSPHRAAILEDGPHGLPEFVRLAADLDALERGDPVDPPRMQQFRRRLERHFLTKAGQPRRQLKMPEPLFASVDARKRHAQAVAQLSPLVHAELERLDMDINRLLARGLHRVLAIAVDKYEGLLREHSLLDFAGMLDRAVALLERQEEFARSRLKLQARYHHVLVDEFQDTSRKQWRLVELLIDAWGEGEGASDSPTSIFVVGDRKQSIYRFRHAEVTLLDEVADRIGRLRPGRRVRQAITTSFRAVPELLAFVNALSGGLRGQDEVEERFRYEESDRFPVPEVATGARRDGEAVLGFVAEPSMEACAAATADEIARLLAHATVRDRSGPPRAARPDDIAILFRARVGHQYFEEALEHRGIRSYVYKGLGFFDAPEVQDMQALLRYLAAPESDLRAAELLRSRLVRLSDVGLARLAPRFAAALRGEADEATVASLGDLDARLLAHARLGVSSWLGFADRIPPSELIDLILRESAYAFELRGRRLDQARENLKKVRALVRRVESRGYATLGRLAAYFETLRAGEESNAVLDASGAVHLMTIHAAKGLEFPIVFVVNLHVPGRGRPAGFSVIERGSSGEPEVAFNTTDATRLEDRRETEELRRLLYVAVTRARDRVYFAAETDPQGKVRRGGRSLASLLPHSLVDAASAGVASPSAEEFEWTTDAGAFAFRVCRPAPPPAERPVEPAGTASPPAPVVALRPAGRRLRRASTSDEPPAPADRRRRRPAGGDRHDRLLGTLVHRLFQRRLDPARPVGDVASDAERLLAPDEIVDVRDVPALAGAASRLYQELVRRQDVRDLFASGECFYEVPFTYDPPEAPAERIRGAADCLVVPADGPATVVEFKTGAPRPEHRRQADLYARALSSALGGRQVDVRILYGQAPKASSRPVRMR